MNWAKPGQRVMSLWLREFATPALHAECLASDTGVKFAPRRLIYGSPQE